MQEEIDITPEALRCMEPPDEAMQQGAEPVDKPVNCSETLLFGLTALLAALARFISWSPLHTTALIVASCFIGLESFYLLIPPRLSYMRIGFLAGILVESKLFFS